MTEAEWLVCERINRNLHFLRNQASTRRLRLFAIACRRSRFMWSRRSKSQRREIYHLERSIDEAAGPRTSFAEAYEEAERAAGIALSWSGRPRDDRECSEEDAKRANARYDKELAYQRRVLHCIFGNPFRHVTLDPVWLTGSVVNLAQGIYDERAFDRMPILADALEDAGCHNQDILQHCRAGGEHVIGCWVVDLLLGKE